MMSWGEEEKLIFGLSVYAQQADVAIIHLYSRAGRQAKPDAGSNIPASAKLKNAHFP